MSEAQPAAPDSVQSLATLEALYDAYHRQALGLAYRLLGDAAEAEEVVQEAFLAAWRAAATYDAARGSVRTWFLTLVRHRAVDALRARARRPQQALDPVDEPSSSVDVADVAAATVDGQVARAALSCLPAEQQQAIEMAYFRGLTHTEIAGLLDTPVGTVKGRIRLGLDRLRVALRSPSPSM